MSETWWFVFGIVFLIGEIPGRGYMLFSLGMASIITGLITLRILNPFIQVIEFSILTAIFFALLRKFAIKVILEKRQ